MSEQRTEKAASGQTHLPPPEAGFARIVETLAVPALIWTGFLRNPVDEKTEVDLGLAKYQITLLEILETKTKGNLTKDEEEFLANMLHSARLAYVRATQMQTEKAASADSSGGEEEPEDRKKE